MPLLLAQVNVARLRQPLDQPDTAGFVAGLAPINALADAAPGFVWRLQDEHGDATALPYDSDPLMIVNLSLWQDEASLRAFAFSGPHRDYLARRREWFLRLATPVSALWWVPSSHRPDPAEARQRLHLLETQGPGPEAFSFARVYPPQPI